MRKRGNGKKLVKKEVLRGEREIGVFTGGRLLRGI